MDRAFKGVWIPKGIWENKDMTWMEKLFITEIESLDKEHGCFASNPYFAEFFNLKVTRTSQIINNLIHKGFILAKYERKGKQIVKRVLTINCRNLFNLLYEPIKKSVRTPLEKCRENNTVNNSSNNIINKTRQPVVEDDLHIDVEVNPVYYDLSTLLADKMEQNDKKVFNGSGRAKKVNAWANDIRKLIEIDGRTSNEVKDVIIWSQADPFWRANILCGKKLREKFPTLFLQMNKPVTETWQDKEAAYKKQVLDKVLGRK